MVLKPLVHYCLSYSNLYMVFAPGVNVRKISKGIDTDVQTFLYSIYEQNS